MVAQRNNLTIALIFLSLLAAPFSALAAEIDKVVFTSAEQTIAPSTPSSQMTVEAEDAAGEAVRGSTVCVQIISSSPSAEFSTNSTSWNSTPVRKLSLTISSNQYRRNFYYRDSSEGTFTLTLRAALRPEGSTCTTWKGSASWTSTQPIVVKVGADTIVDAAPAAPADAAPKYAASPSQTKKQYATEKSKYSSNMVGAEVFEEQRADPGAPQTAASGLFSGSLWWVAVLGLVLAGCIALFLSRKSVKQEATTQGWNIIEEKGE